MKRILTLFVPTFSFIQRNQPLPSLLYQSHANFNSKRYFAKSVETSIEPSFVPFSIGQEIEIQIDDLTNLGMGVGRKEFEDGSKWVVMVEGTIPGETVKVSIEKNFKSYSEAKLTEILVPSKHRVVPKCDYFSACGGCQYQHMTIDSQREWKKKQVINGLNRIAGLKDSNLNVNEVIGSKEIFSYRSKISPFYSLIEDDVKIGFQMKNSNNLVSIDKCIIATDNINKKLEEIRRNFTENKQMLENDKQYSLLFREGNNGKISTEKEEKVKQTINNIEFQFKAGDFFQNNRFLLPLMVDHVIQEASNSEFNCQYLIDTYCGSGLFALTSASKFKSVYGIEVSKSAIKSAKSNAKNNEIKNAFFYAEKSENIFKKVDTIVKNSETAVIIDPPRTGCDKSFVTQLISFKPKVIVYVSCDPSTQARDLKKLVEAGYKVGSVTPFDLFPQTRHIESVVSFYREF